MPTAFDTTENCSQHTQCLKEQGYTTIIRYYCRAEITWKRITQKEALAIARGGVRIAAVYQNRQRLPEDFSEAKGHASGKDAYDFAENVVFQPAESAIYFSVDFDASEAVIRANVVPFFRGIKAAFEAAAAGDDVRYDIGVYGSGRTCRFLLEENLVKYTWITQSTGFAEYKKFLNSGRWHLKQLMPIKVCGIEGDPNEVNPERPDFGAFELDPAAFGPAAPAAESSVAADDFVVIAGTGLRIRSGPGTDYDVTAMLSSAARVRVLARSGDWAMIDSTHDGKADGFVLAAYLRPA